MIPQNSIEPLYKHLVSHHQYTNTTTDQHFPDGFNTEAINCHRQSSAAPRPGAVCGETEAAAAAGEEREKNLSKMAAMNRKLENDTFYGSSTLVRHILCLCVCVRMYTYFSRIHAPEQTKRPPDTNNNIQKINFKLKSLV